MKISTASLALAALTTVGLAPLSAQGDFAYDKKSPATFGKTLQLAYTGAPQGKPMMFMVSLNRGPTPLKLLFGGTDNRSLQVGVDLVPVWFLTTTTATGAGAFPPVLMPNSAPLQGTPVHLQLMTGPGTGGNVVDKISHKIVVVGGASGTTDLLAAKLGDGRTPKGPGRALMAAFPLAGKNGNVMVAGGGTGNMLNATGLRTSEVLDFRTLEIKPGPNLVAPRASATVTVLTNGRVLLAGGVDSMGDVTATCEIYDPVTNTFTATGSMGTKRAGHAAALLPNGRVLVAAGTSDLKTPASTILGILKSCEIYNPATGTWSTTASIAEKVLGPALTTLTTGKVLVSGGAKITLGIFNIPVSVDSVTRCQLFTPSGNSGSWANTGSMVQHRALHGENTILLSGGRVLVTGGVVVRIPLIPLPQNFAGAQSSDKAEYYNPATGSWVALPRLAEKRFGHTATEMPDGKVLVVGGAKGALDAATSVRNIQEFNPATNTFVRSFNLRTARATHGAALLPDGNLIAFGGTSSATATTTLDSLEIIHQ